MTNHALRCEEVRRQIQARLDDELSAHDCAELDLHIDSCPPCAGWLTRLQAEDKALTDFLGGAPDTALDLARMEEVIRGRIAASVPARGNLVGSLAELLLAATGVAVAVGVLSLGKLNGTVIVSDFLRDLRMESSLTAFVAPITLAVASTFLCLLAIGSGLAVLSRKEFSNAANSE